MKRSETISSDGDYTPSIDLESNNSIQLGNTLQIALIKNLVLYVGYQLVTYLLYVYVHDFTINTITGITQMFLLFIFPFINIDKLRNIHGYKYILIVFFIVQLANCIIFTKLIIDQDNAKNLNTCITFIQSHNITNLDCEYLVNRCRINSYIKYYIKHSTDVGYMC